MRARGGLAAAFAGALLLALGGLAGARYLPGAHWIDALWVAGGSSGLALALAVAIVTRARWPRTWHYLLAPCLAVSAAFGRAWLVTSLSAPERAAPPLIEPLRMGLGASTVVWSALALWWGIQGITDAFDVPDLSRRQRAGRLVAAGGAVTLALHALAPLWTLLGLRIGPWTAIGLFGLAVLAYLASALYRRFC